MMKLSFPYNPQLIEQIKTIPQRSWNPNDKTWEIPDEFLATAINYIRPHYPDVAQGLEDYALNAKSASPLLMELGESASTLDLTSPETKEIVEKVRNDLNLPYTLYPYQELCVAFMETAESKGILIADAMGLGKTIETIAWLSLHPELSSTVIVTPASVKLNWQRELQKWIPNSKVQVIKNGSDTFKDDQDFYIVNYDLIWRMEDKMLELDYKTLVLDEVTYIKEGKSKRTKMAKKLGKTAEKVIGLSGTPILNRPIEFFNFLNMTDSKLFSNLISFGTRYCGGKQISIPSRFGRRMIWNFNGATNLTELGTLLKPFTIRRLKSQVLTELPDKRREFLYLDLPKKFKTAYLANEKKLIWELSDVNAGASLQSTDILSLLGRLRHIIGQAKADVAKEYIQQFVNSGDKLLVFGHHHDVLDSLETYLSKEGINYVRADGSTNAENRDKAITKFQTDDKCLVFLATTAMGMGVTLTAASNALFIERQWSPGMEEQMEDRVHRIGQKRGVIVWYMQIEDTIDERMSKVVENKRGIITEILDESRGESIEGSSLVDEVLESYL